MLLVVYTIRKVQKIVYLSVQYLKTESTEFKMEIKAFSTSVPLPVKANSKVTLFVIIFCDAYDPTNRDWLLLCKK